MKINLSPIAGNYTTKITVSGLVLTIDDKDYDLSQIPVGGDATDESVDSPFIGTITRDEVTIRYFYESAKAIPNQSTNIEDYSFDVLDGEIPSPIIWKEV